MQSNNGQKHLNMNIRNIVVLISAKICKFKELQNSMLTQVFWQSLLKLIGNIISLHTSTNQFQKGCMTYLLTGLVSTELYFISQHNTTQQSVERENYNSFECSETGCLKFS